MEAARVAAAMEAVARAAVEMEVAATAVVVTGDGARGVAARHPVTFCPRFGREPDSRAARGPA